VRGGKWPSEFRPTLGPAVIGSPEERERIDRISKELVLVVEVRSDKRRSNDPCQPGLMLCVASAKVIIMQTLEIKPEFMDRTVTLPRRAVNNSRARLANGEAGF
jgi:hypothetical protein